MDNLDTLRKGVGMAVGNGKCTLFWKHCWASKITLLDPVIREPPGDIKGCTVEDMWDVSYGWKWEVFSDFLNPRALQEVDSFELQTDEEAIDRIYWNRSDSGGFSIKFPLKIIRGEGRMGVQKCWAATWKVRALQKVRFFIWLALQVRLMTNENQIIRGFTNDASCLWCGANEETVDHIIRRCPAAQKIWWKFLGMNGHELFGKEVNAWIYSNIQPIDDTRDEDWPAVFATTIWWLWKWHNNRCFGREVDIPVDQLGL